MRLTLLVADSPVAQPKLMLWFPFSRFKLRDSQPVWDEQGDLVLLEDQDRSKWDSRLIALVVRRLALSAAGKELSEFHVQAAIASLHAQATDPATTDWPTILDLYDDLMALNPSGVVAVNRIVAVGKVHGPECALGELAHIENNHALRDYYLLPATRGALLAQKREFAVAANFFEVALGRPCSEPERRFLIRRMNECREQALWLQKPSWMFSEKSFTLGSVALL